MMPVSSQRIAATTADILVSHGGFNITVGNQTTTLTKTRLIHVSGGFNSINANGPQITAGRVWLGEKPINLRPSTIPKLARYR